MRRMVFLRPCCSAVRLDGFGMPRPLTHDLINEKLTACEAYRMLKFGCCVSRWFVSTGAVLVVALISEQLNAAPFAVFDPRSMALGGAGVAEATTAAAGYYNPGLFALFRDDEDKPSHSRWAAPIVSAKFSNSFQELGEFQDQNYDGGLRAAIVNYNDSAGDTALLSQVANAARLFQTDLNKVANEPQLFDVLAGFSIGLSSDQNGGGFFATARTYGSGEVRLSTVDRQLLADYGSLDSVRCPPTGQDPSSPLLDPITCDLIDRTSELTSSVVAQAVFLFEAGVPFGSRIRHQGRSWYVGVTPKIQTLATFDFDENVHERNVNIRKDSTARTGINADIGIATYWSERIRIGSAIKDIRPREITTDLGNRIAVGPNWRIGAAYLGDRFTITGDIDVLPSEPVGVEPRSHHIMGGAEYTLPANIHIRGGFRFDARSGPERFTWSVGTGAVFRAFFTDVAYAQNTQTRAAAMQFGIRF